MQPLKKQCAQLAADVAAAYDRLDIDAKADELAKVDQQLSDSAVWTELERAKSLSKRSAALRAQIEPWQTLRTQVKDLAELMELGDDSLSEEFKQQLSAFGSDYQTLRRELLFGGRFDANNAILRLSAGAGGTDAQDWAQMLERMYLRWAEKSGLEASIIERSSGDEAGLKTSVIEISGAYAYGKLRSEHGVHRLVRLSPFNSDNLRQTSFALVEILPEIDRPDDVVLDDKDLKIDVYRAGGHGGQSVNTTDSAVRVTHLPTGIVVAIQNERSQLQNKETAFKILRSKLAQMQIEQHAQNLSELQAGESASWGSQIRNYVLHPYQLVKDTRTKFEDKDTRAVLDGKLDDFMKAFLEQSNSTS